MKRTLILIIIILALAGAGTGFYFFNKKVGGLENVKADYTITSSKLYDAFETKEEDANKKYLDKVLIVKGTVDKIEIDKNYSSIILKADDALWGGVNCSFNHELTGISNGDVITIKGRCQGYLTDVVLNSCNIEYE